MQTDTDVEIKGKSAEIEIYPHRISCRLRPKETAKTPPRNADILSPFISLSLSFADFPKEGPTISSPRQQYQVGETAHLRCSAEESNPPTQLAWYINGEPVS